MPNSQSLRVAVAVALVADLKNTDLLGELKCNRSTSKSVYSPIMVTFDVSANLREVSTINRSASWTA
ncbi:hypothetical protein DPMN_123976 [Dreissena polymorpha]|uniref:Uncharacterized protein n=1 Tax=Dreissena polymorpha TaxID=45954 RepID=A0A9D4GSN0_DREPO|nr:hypothetical protein DPMN_123976 [Dreissena polymorpha]